VLENILVGMHARTTTGPLAPSCTRGAAGPRNARPRTGLEIIGAFGNRLLPRTNQLVKELSTPTAAGSRSPVLCLAAEGPPARRTDRRHDPAETLELSDQIRSLRTMGSPSS